jgi:hypothetical protein
MVSTTTQAAIKKTWQRLFSPFWLWLSSLLSSRHPGRTALTPQQRAPLVLLLGAWWLWLPSRHPFFFPSQLPHPALLWLWAW